MAGERVKERSSGRFCARFRRHDTQFSRPPGLGKVFCCAGIALPFPCQEADCQTGSSKTAPAVPSKEMSSRRRTALLGSGRTNPGGGLLRRRRRSTRRFVTRRSLRLDGWPQHHPAGRPRSRAVLLSRLPGSLLPLTRLIPPNAWLRLPPRPAWFHVTDRPWFSTASIGLEDNGWLGVYCPRQGGQHDHRPGLRNPYGRGPSLKRARCSFTAQLSPASTRLPCSRRRTATGPIGIWEILHSRSLSRSNSVAVTGAEDRGRSGSPICAGRRWGGVSPSRLRPGKRTARPRGKMQGNPRGPRRG